MHAAAATELVQAGEAAGFDTAWTIEHTVVPANYKSPYPYSPSGKMAGGVDDLDLPDPLIWMTYMAAVTSTIKFGTAVLILPQHSPVVTAKQVATLDHLSGGRVLLGIGVGWMREEFFIHPKIVANLYLSISKELFCIFLSFLSFPLASIYNRLKTS